MPGLRLLGLVQRMMRTGRAMARCVNRIARQKLEGQDLSRLAPAGFDATSTNAFVVLAVAWTAALRERLLALAGRPLVQLAPGLPKTQRGKRARGAAGRLVEITYEVDPEDHHDWPELAKSWRMGPGGLAVAARMIAGKSNREVVTDICDNLRRAAAQLGAEADLERIAALEAAALALCPGADAAEDADGSAGGTRGARGAWSAGPPSDEPEDGAGDDPPPEPPD